MKTAQDRVSELVLAEARSYQYAGDATLGTVRDTAKEIHEAMRELEDERETEAFSVEAFMAVDVDKCLAKIRAALAGERKE